MIESLLSPEEAESAENLIEDRKFTKPVVSIDELEIDCEGKEKLEPLLKSMLDDCARYTVTVAKYKEILQKQMSGDLDANLAEMEPIRTAVHNATISSIQILARALGEEYIDNAWIRELGDAETQRAAYGRFALLITLERLRKQKSS